MWKGKKTRRCFWGLVLKNTVGLFGVAAASLATKSVQGSALSLQGVDNIHGSDGLTTRVLGVRDGVTDDVLEEHLEDSTSLLVDQTADALDSTTARQPADGRLGDTGNVVAQNLAVALGTSLSETLGSFSSSFSSSRHFCFFNKGKSEKRVRQKEEQKTKEIRGAPLTCWLRKEIYFFFFRVCGNRQ